ncbi:MAG TPA: preprotein translocase subunit SecA [Burkholderiales bacterium]|nr:preprotein translocase subunit SecA [Burkholderiales bacterium]
MSAVSHTFVAGPYPEREEARENALDRLISASRYIAGRRLASRRRLSRIVDAVRAREEVDELTLPEITARANALRPRLRREGFTLPLAGEVFALVRAAATKTLGLRHFDVQLIGGWALLNGMVAEMATGEGKTLTATLAAATAALGGRAVHVITVNDYLASRDAEWMLPVYSALGLTVGCVVHDVEPAQRRNAYAQDVTYCSNKEIAFDYLRDRLLLGGRLRPVASKVDVLGGGELNRKLLLRGLQFAIVDEADSVLIDEARTPLILSAQASQTQEEQMYRQALELAAELPGEEFAVKESQIELTDAALRRLEERGRSLGGVWSGPRRREQLVRKALTALYLFQRDKHYLLRDGKVVIIDEFTGRLMPDRSWEQGLHQLIEIKEGCEVTGRRETLARISYQRFFRRYVHLSGMTGTAAEVADELWAVYRLRVAKVPTHRPVRRMRFPDLVFGSAEAKWKAVVAETERLHRAGRPVLIGTRSVAASEHLASLFDGAGLPYQLLNARQDKLEAEIIARAGEPGRITVATNMAGRGTDIKLMAGVAERGGLHVISAELNDSARIDRQLYGRGARQGDHGSCQGILAMEDDLVATYLPWTCAWLSGRGRLPTRAGRLLFHLAQRRAERIYSRARRDLLDLDEQLGDMLAFAGRGE